MEIILIATDFSDASRNATLYGIKLSKLLRAKVVLLNVYPFILPSSELPAMITDKDLLDNSSTGLSEEINWLALQGFTEIEKRSEQGKTSEVILSVAKEIKARWIIAGMKGAGSIARKFIGGTAFSLSRHSDIPLILIPGDAKFKVPRL